MRILVVEDDTLLASGIRAALAQAGFTADAVGSAEHALAALQTGESFDLAIVDIGLPGIDGLELVRRLRAQRSALPALVLTARDSLEDCVNALQLGADDYLTKPFRVPELVARIHAVLRRAQARSEQVLRFGPLVMDVQARSCDLAGRPLELTPSEWQILEMLATSAPRVATRERLVQTLAGWDRDLSGNALEVHVSRLRAKLEGALLIRTIRGLGYRLDEPE
ncbi:MAG: response regulator transcription factor [Rhodocyclaceae bacterium]|nr:response regulator transcription factor [Rhodocyclaceae bacterium]